MSLKAIAMRQTGFLLISVGTVRGAASSNLLPDGNLKPGVKITIPAGEEREILFQPQGVRFLAGKTKIVSIAAPLVDPEGQEKRKLR